MSIGKHLVCFLFCSLAVPVLGDDLADDFVSGFEFEGVFKEETSIVSEDFLAQNNWSEPEFSLPQGVRDIASLDGVEAAEPSDPDRLQIGRLEVLEEIPYTYPWLKRWQVVNKVRRYRRRRRATKK